MNQYSPVQVGAPCMGHQYRKASPRSKKMSQNCLWSWNGENRVVQHLPALLIAWVLGLWYRNWYYNDKCRNVVGVNLHTIKNLPRRKWQAIATVRLNGLDYSKKEPDTKCKSVCLNEYRRKKRRYCSGHTLVRRRMQRFAAKKPVLTNKPSRIVEYS